MIHLHWQQGVIFIIVTIYTFTRTELTACNYTSLTPNGLKVNCSGLGLDEFPSNLPNDTVILDLKNNNLTTMSFADLFPLKNLTEIHLGGNSMACICEIRWLYLALTSKIHYFEKMNITGAECWNDNGKVNLIQNLKESDFTCNYAGLVISKDKSSASDIQCASPYRVYNRASFNSIVNELTKNGENVSFWVDGMITNGTITFSNGKSMPIDKSLFRKGEPNGSGVCTQLWYTNKWKLDDVDCSRQKKYLCSGECYTCENEHTFGECSINTTQCSRTNDRCFTRISYIGNDQYSVSKGCTDMPTTQCDDCKRSDNLFLPRNCTYVCGTSHCNAFLPSDFIQWNMCPHSVTCYANYNIQWRPTPAGTETEVKCPFVSPRTGLTATRQCHSNAEWGQPDMSQCDTVTTTPATYLLYELTKISPNAQNAPGIAKALSNLTSAAEYFAAVDVYLAVYVIDNLLNTNDTNTTSIDVATDLLNSVDNLFNVEPEVLVTSQRDGDTASRLIKAIDQLAMDVQNVQNKTATIETENIVISIVRLNTSVYTGISFSVSDNNQMNIDNDNTSPMDNVKSAIQLPSSLLDGHSFQDGSSRAQFISYKSNMFFKAVGAALSDDVIPTSNHVISDHNVSNDTIYKVLNSAVIGASIGSLIISDLEESVKINLTWQRANLFNPQCVYWNYSLNDDVGGWSRDGCNVLGQSSNNFITCECDHLTNFALLMDVYGTASEFDESHQKALSIVSYIGCGISLFCMLLTLITFLAFRRLRKDNPTKILMNLCFAIFMSILLFLAVSFSVDFAPIIPELCTTMAVLLHYFLLAVMTWMALEAFNMYLLLVKVFETYIRHFMIKLCLIGWGTPVVIVAITLAIDIDNYGYHNNICWLSRYAFFAAFLAPVCLVLIFNTVIYILVVHQICSLNSKNMSTSDRYGKAAQLRGSVSLFVLLGITWALAILAISEAGLVVNYLFAIANSLQGLIIFIFFCALRKDVQKEWRDAFCSRCQRSSRSADSGSTSAKKYLHRDTDSKSDLKSEPSTEKHLYDNTSSSEL